LKRFYLLIIIILFSKGFAETSNTSEYWFQKGYQSNNIGKYNIAILQYQKALRIAPEDAIIFLNMGLAYASDGKDIEAMECFQKVTEIDSCNAAAYYNMGLIYFHTGNTEKELECYQKAIELDSVFVMAYYNMGIIFYNKGETEKEMEYHQKAIEIGTDDGLEFYKLGMTYAKKGWKNTALENFYDAGLIYLEQNDSIKALQTIEVMDTLLINSELVDSLKINYNIQFTPISFSTDQH